MDIGKLQLSIRDVLDFLEANWKYAKKEEKESLAKLLNAVYVPEKVIDEPIDMLTEVQEQMKMLRVLRSQITSLGVDANPKDLQSLVSTSTSLFAMLTKYSNDMVNQDRIKKIEAAVVESVKTLSEEVQTHFFGKLEELLSA